MAVWQHNITHNMAVWQHNITHNCSSVTSWSEGYSVFYYILVAAFLQVSAIINILVILIVCCTPRLRTTSNVYISSLAVNELIFAMFITARSAIASHGMLTGEWPDSCQFVVHVMIFIWLSTLCSNYTNILMISLERWLYISKPFLHQKLNRASLVIFTLILAWTFPVAVNLEIVTYSDIHQNLRLKFIYLFPIFHLVWSATLAVIYIHICVITRRQIKVICKMTIVDRPPEKTTASGWKPVRENWKTFKMLVIVFGTFFVLNTPGIVYNLYLVLAGSEDFYADVPWYIKLLTVIHNCSNYFIYIHQDKTFYKVFSKSFRKMRNCRAGNSFVTG